MSVPLFAELSCAYLGPIIDDHFHFDKVMRSDIRTTPAPNCPICGCSGQPLYHALRDRLFGAPGEWNFSRCSNFDCGLLWLDPQPVEEDIPLAYGGYYTHARLEPKSLLSRFLSLSLRTLANAVTLVSGLVKERRAVANMHLADLPPGRLLEIGCGDGEFLAKMKDRGWSAEGLDFDSSAASAALENFGVVVRVGRLEDLAYPERTFDAIVMKHVLEHVFDPLSTLRQVSRILKPGGQLVVVTPNARSLGQRTYGPNWRGLEPPRHIHIFTPGALDSSARAAGLETIRAYSTAANAWGIFAGSIFLAKGGSILGPDSKPAIIDILRSFLLQLREARENRTSLYDGEECVLLARKHVAPVSTHTAAS